MTKYETIPQGHKGSYYVLSVCELLCISSSHYARWQGHLTLGKIDRTYFQKWNECYFGVLFRMVFRLQECRT